jgi:hypothetical protein
MGVSANQDQLENSEADRLNPLANCPDNQC